MVEAVRGTPVEMSWAFLGRRDFSFHAFSEGTRRVLFRAGTRAGPGRCIAAGDREIPGAPSSRVVPFETKDLLFSTYRTWQRHSTPPRRYEILTYARLRDRASPWPRQVYYAHYARIVVHIIDTIADSLWYFNDTARIVIPSIRGSPCMNYSKGVTSSSEFHVKC